uniref:Zgc:162255 n=1 Tax=Tetraodon nigroviridis TaxID=99883 RepID=H3CE71_TETNG
MGTTTSEPCIYDKLAESIDILRQSGQRYGMSEREIERFIKQVLETNEPRREPPQFPILRATIKFVVVVGFLLVMVLAFTYPQSSPQLGLAALGPYNWSSPLSHVRLLSLPIAKKYNLQGFHEWWGAGSAGRTLVNCSVCAEIYSVLEVPQSLRAAASVPRGAQLLLLKVSPPPPDRVRDPPRVLEKLPDNDTQTAAFVPGVWPFWCRWWRFSPGTREKVLRWLFPKAELSLLLDGSGSSVQRCLVTHSTSAASQAVGLRSWLLVGEGLPTVRVLPVQQCRKHCSSFSLWLQSGDVVYADPRYWEMELYPSPGQNIICAGSAG